MQSSRPVGPSVACKITAPAPSPKSTQVLRSCQSMRRDSVSAPITSAVLCAPALISRLATPSA